MFRFNVLTTLAILAPVIRAGLFEQCDTLFEEFKSKYHKTYSSSVEEAKRSKVFCANMKLADQ